ncbi:MAG: cyclophilin-like fold protein [Oscillospiraceae bacterium]|nr:cyclophilin-like fold protein [Oscillospiraceae bacterium]
MKKYTFIIPILLLMLILTACGGAERDEMAGIPQTETESGISQESGTGSTAPEEAIAAETKSKDEEVMKVSIKSAEYEIIYELNDSQAAKELYAQLPLELEVEPFSNNEMTFYPPKKLSTGDTPLSGGEIGSLSYYAPWGDVVMFYAPCSPNGSLYELGTAVSGTGDIAKLSGTITIAAYAD